MIKAILIIAAVVIVIVVIWFAGMLSVLAESRARKMGVLPEKRKGCRFSRKKKPGCEPGSVVMALKAHALRTLRAELLNA